MIVDTHCHIDRFPNPLALAEKCEVSAVGAVAVTNLPSHYEMAVEHLRKMRYVKPSLGFHPLTVKENLKELPLFLSLLGGVQFVGEIGLDFSDEGEPTRNEQLQVFRTIVEALSDKARFVTLHSRGAAGDVAHILDEYGVQKCVFHWFSGTLKELEKVVSSGHYLSINTAMVESKKGQRVLERAPRDRILTESDGPYVKIGRRPAGPFDMMRVVSGIADAWGVSEDEAESQVSNNYKRLCESIGITNG